MNWNRTMAILKLVVALCLVAMMSFVALSMHHRRVALENLIEQRRAPTEFPQ